MDLIWSGLRLRTKATRNSTRAACRVKPPGLLRLAAWPVFMATNSGLQQAICHGGRAAPILGTQHPM
ncbi:MAG: hypothetical protein HN559_05230 [Gemmatimonadetes bacterium]|nr:hypothetical protein [Gemmatimonadota bacterium]MBT7594287.1 hypothetical protein [Gemmatimonadota bacterium]